MINNKGTGRLSGNPSVDNLGQTRLAASSSMLNAAPTATFSNSIPGYPEAGVAVSTGSAWGSSITLGTGVSTALGVNIGTAGSFIVNGGALGAPVSGNFISGLFTWPTFNQNTTGTASNITGTLAVSQGGTGITSFGTGVQTALGNAVNATGGLVTYSGNLGTPTAAVLTNATGLPLSTGISGVLPIANGGTGQTTANAAFNVLAPSQTSANTKVLTSDGTNTSFQPLVPSSTTGNIPVATATGSLSDSAKYFSDSITSSLNIWSASQTQTAITNGLLNTPTLPSANLATTANLSLTGAATVDGVAVVTGNIVHGRTRAMLHQFRFVMVGKWVRPARHLEGCPGAQPQTFRGYFGCV